MSFLTDRFPLYVSWMSKACYTKSGMSLSANDARELGEQMLKMYEFTESLTLDELTGMLVRKMFFVELTQAVKPYVRKVLSGQHVEQDELVCLVGDVAMLSYANSKGHLVGDRLLRTISKEMLGISSLQRFGRPGGDELAGFARHVHPDVVAKHARTASLRIATKPHRQLDVGISSLRDVQKLFALKKADGTAYVDVRSTRSVTKLVVDSLFAIAMERAQIEKIAFRLHFLAKEYLGNQEFFAEVKPHAIKSSGGVTMRRVRSLARKLVDGKDIWKECYLKALQSRNKDMSSTPYQQGVHQIAKLSLM